MRYLKIAGGVLVFILLIIVIVSSGGHPKAPPKVTPYTTIPVAPQQKGPSPTPTGRPGQSSAPSFAPTPQAPSPTPPAALPVTPQGTDAQEQNPNVQAGQHQALASHPLFQKLPLTEYGVTLTIGDFGTPEAPGILVAYTGSIGPAISAVARIFSQHHDHESAYTIHYAGGG